MSILRPRLELTKAFFHDMFSGIFRKKNFEFINILL